jgi:hypothetical protein
MRKQVFLFIAPTKAWIPNKLFFFGLNNLLLDDDDDVDVTEQVKTCLFSFNLFKFLTFLFHLLVFFFLLANLHGKHGINMICDLPILNRK